MDNKISIQSSINSYRLSIDSNLKSIERINTTVKKITADNDIKSLTNAIEDLRNIINNTDSIIRDFILPNYRSEELFALITRLTSFNQIGNMIYSFGNRPIDLYMKLKNKKQSVDKFLKDQAKLRLNGIPEKELNKILSSLFENDSIISPNCDMEQFSTCPFYRISKVDRSDGAGDVNARDPMMCHSFHGEIPRLDVVGGAVSSRHFRHRVPVDGGGITH